MNALYRMPFVLPTLVVALLLMALLLAGCDSAAPPATTSRQAGSNVYVEALREAEAVKHSAEQRQQEQQRIDALLGRDQAPAR